MALLLETTIGDLVIDLDVDGSPALCKNVLKLAKARYYTGNLVYNVQPNRFCQFGDPCGEGSGGACIYGVLDAYEQSRKKNDDGTNQNQNQKNQPNILTSQRRFLKSDMGRALTEDECRQRGRLVATEMNGIADTIGSQLLITIDEGPDRGLDSFRNNNSNNNKDGVNKSVDANEELTPQKFRSVGMVVEDDNGVLEKLNTVYCDSNGRPYADVRIIRAMVIDDPFDDPEGMDQLLEDRGVTFTTVGDDGSAGGTISDDNAGDSSSRRCSTILDSPDYERPPEEKVETRISADDIDDENATEGDLKKMRLQEEERLKRDDKSRAVVLEMLGDLPSANITAPENVLFVCKLNPVTEDDDLELIFSRFDEKVSADIVRDHKTGASLQYAFVEFTSKDQAAEAYFKMNNALVDDRRIKVDFSQSVSKVWDRFNQRNRKQSSSNHSMPKDPFREQQQPQQISQRNNSRGDIERNNDTSSYRRGNSGKMSNYSPHHTNHRPRYDTKNQSRDFSRRDHERYRGANHNKNFSSRNTDRAMSDSHRDDHRSRPSGGYQTHRDHDRDRNRDRNIRDRHNYDINYEKKHHEGRDRDSLHFRTRNNRDDGDKDSRSRDHSPHRTDRRRDESFSTRSRERNQGYDSGTDTSERSRSRRRKRSDEGRRRRSRSSSRSSSGSCVERRERHRSSHKKAKKKRDRRRDDDTHHHKRSKRDSKHRHHRKDRDEARGRERHRGSPKSTRS
jgi:peptidyl-prolyl cis-trans isomerase-like 4